MHSPLFSVLAVAGVALAQSVSQIYDGQIQAPTVVPSVPVVYSTSAPPKTTVVPPVVPKPTTTAPVVYQIGDGQIQAPTSIPYYTPPKNTTVVVVPPVPTKPTGGVPYTNSVGALSAQAGFVGAALAGALFFLA